MGLGLGFSIFHVMTRLDIVVVFFHYDAHNVLDMFKVCMSTSWGESVW